MAAYYNECDPFAAKWLRNLSAAGLIAPGDVDDRSILDVRPGDLAGYTQHHFFAGIGGWSLALRLAGWPDERPIWTGSCPCQPLSSAGLRQGDADERHLWPAFFGLIAECRPSTVSGEQVASKDGREWFAAVRADLETLGYAVGGADLCSPGVGVGWEETGPAEWLEWAILHCPYPDISAEMRDFADWAGRALISGPPNIRQRLYWLAYAAESGRNGQPQRPSGADGRTTTELGRLCDAGGLADIPFSGWREERSNTGRGFVGDPAQRLSAGSLSGGSDLWLDDANGRHTGAERIQRGREYGQQPEDGGTGRMEHTNSSGWDEGQLAAQANGHRSAPGSDGGALGLGDPIGTGLEIQHRQPGDDGPQQPAAERAGQAAGAMDEAQRVGRGAGRDSDASHIRLLYSPAGAADPVADEGGRPCPRHCGWADADWLFCTDGTYRPVEPGTFPLASGIPGRVGVLRGAGNAINPDLAADFMRAVMEVIPS